MAAVTSVNTAQQMMNFQKSPVMAMWFVSAPNWKKFVPKIDCIREQSGSGE
jgi:hypothetical protein